MLKILALPLGSYQTNCYIIHDETSKSCCVIDPGFEPDTVLQKVNSLGLTLDAILLTHGHFDHVGAVKDIAAETDCDVYIHAADLDLPAMLTAGKLYYTHTYDEGDSLRLAGLDITVFHTPGHTPGCVCLLCETSLFSGDTLFAGSCGRTDLPGGDQNVLFQSLLRLAAMEEDYTEYPGHSGSTTLAREKQYNPFIKRARAAQ